MLSKAKQTFKYKITVAIKTVAYTCSSLLVKSFLKKNDTAQVLKGIRGSEKKLPQSPPVCLNILNIDAR